MLIVTHAPLIGETARVMDRLLARAGVPRAACEIVVHTELPSTLPNIVLALGDQAAWTLVGTWPGAKDGTRGTIAGARVVHKRRGYMWDGAQGTLRGAKVMTTLHPEIVKRDASGISEMLVTLDIERAWAERGTPELHRPAMHIEVISTHDEARAAARAIRAIDTAACDIEITQDGERQSVLCVGFATSASRAYVFTLPMLAYAYDLLLNARTTIWQNGQFDLHFLATRAGIHVAGDLEDVIVAWHTRWPEIAGAALDVDGAKRGSKRTNKSLAFFASLYSKAPWWKDYSVDALGMARLCGQDCCITYATHLMLQLELAELGLHSVYRLTMQRVRPVATMQARGVLINEARRRSAIAELDVRRDEALLEMAALAEPLLDDARERLPRADLIWQRSVCPCCRNGSKKRAACAVCSGVTDESKAGLMAAYTQAIRSNGGSLTDKAARIAGASKLTVAQLRAAVMRPCVKCGGAGAWETYAFNPASNEQLSMLLYDVLHLPRRKGVDEASLKGLIGQVHQVQQDAASRASGHDDAQT